MSVGHAHGSEHSGPSGSDVFIAMLMALVAAGVVWATVYGVFAGAIYGLEYFKITVPEIVTTVLHTASTIVPVLAAIPAAWVGYKFTLKLP